MIIFIANHWELWLKGGLITLHGIWPLAATVCCRDKFLNWHFLERSVLRVSASREPNIHIVCIRCTCNDTLMRSPEDRPLACHSLDLITHFVWIPKNQHHVHCIFYVISAPVRSTSAFGVAIIKSVYITKAAINTLMVIDHELQNLIHLFWIRH